MCCFRWKLSIKHIASPFPQLPVMAIEEALYSWIYWDVFVNTLVDIGRAIIIYRWFLYYLICDLALPDYHDQRFHYCIMHGAYNVRWLCRTPKSVYPSGQYAVKKLIAVNVHECAMPKFEISKYILSGYRGIFIFPCSAHLFPVCERGHKNAPPIM